MPPTRSAVVLLADFARARSLVEQLTSNNLNAVAVHNSEELFEQLSGQGTDLVVIENELNGFFTGLEMLQRLYQSLWHPTTIVLADATPEVNEQSARLGVSAVIPWQTRHADIVHVVRGILADEKVSQSALSPEAFRIVDQCSQIQPLPQLLVKIVGYLEVENVSIKEFAEEISVDARATADLLKLTNSTAMGLRNKFTNVFDAVNFLGVRRAIATILSGAMVGYQQQLQRDVPKEIRKWYNNRSVLIASTASTFARNFEPVTPDHAHVLGLFQDLGVLVLSIAHGSRYVQLVERVKLVPQLRRDHAERESFQVTHAETSAALLSKWGMPPAIVSLVLHHHDRVHEASDACESALLRVMQIGEAFADLMDNSAAQRLSVLNRLLDHYGTTRHKLCRSSLTEAAAAAMDASRLFSLPLPNATRLHEVISEFCDRAWDTNDDGSLVNTDPPAGGTVATAGVAASEKPSRNFGTEGLPSKAWPKNAPTVAYSPLSDEKEERLALVIDDDAHSRKLLTTSLESTGWGVVTCSTMRSAHLVSRRVNAVFCEVSEQYDHGLQIVERMRSDGFTGPLIVISNDATRQAVDRAVQIGATGYFVRPLDTTYILDKLATMDCVPQRTQELPDPHAFSAERKTRVPSV